jgi:HEAT repeat protein
MWAAADGVLRRVQTYLAVLAWLCGTKIEDALSAPSVSGLGPMERMDES